MCIGFGPIVRNIFLERYRYDYTRTAISSEALVSQLIFERLLRTRNQSSEKQDSRSKNEGHSSNGRLNTLLTLDMDGIYDAQDFIWPCKFPNSSINSC